MATLQSCRLIPGAPAPFAVSMTARPPPSTSAFVPLGCRRRERHHWPSLSLNQQRHARQPGAIRPCLVARAHKLSDGLPPWSRPDDESADRSHYFVEERKRVMDLYNEIMYIDYGCLYIEATKMSGQLCLCAKQVLTIASQIMSSAAASQNLGAPNETSTSISISADTIHTTLRAYVKIFVDAADAAHGRTVSKATATSFLGALRALASVSHILLDALGETHPRERLAEYALNGDVEAMRGEFGRHMDGIEDRVSKASVTEKWGRVVMPGIMEATWITLSFVRLMVARRKRALEKADSKVVPAT